MTRRGCSGAVVARRHGIAVGDRLEANGRQLRVVGLSRSTGFMLDYVFVTHALLGYAERSTLQPESVGGRPRRRPVSSADRTAQCGW
jgi:hypothetical protein